MQQEATPTKIGKRLYRLMQKATKIAPQKSPHPVNRVGAVLQLADGTTLSSSNLTLKAFADDKDDTTKIKIGSSSPTKHAETALIAKATQQGHSVKGATLHLNTVPCPNCMQFMAASGIKHIVIDETPTDWEERRGYHYRATSLQMAANAGITVSRLKTNKTKRSAKETPETLPPRTEKINFEDHYRITKVKAKNFNPKLYEESPHLKSNFSARVQTSEKNSYKNRNTVIVIPPQADENGNIDPEAEYTLVKAEAVRTIKKIDKERLLKKQPELQGVSKSKLQKELNKYFTAVFSLDMARAALGREGIPITEDTMIYSNGVPSSHELVSLADVQPLVQLKIDNHDLYWKKIDLDALQAFKNILCDLEVPPQTRTTTDLFKPSNQHPNEPFITHYNAQTAEPT